MCSIFRSLWICGFQVKVELMFRTLLPHTLKQNSYSDPDDPQPMPATVSIRRNAHGTSSGSEDSVSSSAVGSSSTGNETVGGVSGGGSGALVELTLGAPEVDSSTGDTVFSLSAEEEVGVWRSVEGGVTGDVLGGGMACCYRRFFMSGGSCKKSAPL